jgi:ATP-binding cassette subfamily F protein 3
MLSVNELDKFLGGRALLEKASFRLTPGETVALVGANGSGKSTLLKICAGQLTADAGQVAFPKDATIGYLPQHAELDSDRPLRDELRQVFAEVLSHQAELDHLAHKMGELDPHSPEYEKVADRWGHLHHELDRLNAYEMDANIGRIAAGLGFANADLVRPCREFSGGWRMRVLLARLLLQNPDIMLLDEPTNHLDLETMIWLEDWIRASDTAILMVSHERAFMDNLAARVFEIHEGRLTIYRGNYTEYLASRQERWAQWAREYANQREEIERIEKFIERFRAKATKAVQVQSRIKQLEKIERLTPPPTEAGSIHFRFPACDRGSKEVFAADDLSIAFGALRVLDDVEFAVWRGERVALVGVNGAGKTTLLKLLLERIQPTAGAVRRGPLTTTEYFAQYETEGLHPNNTVFGEVASVAPLGSDQQARNLLGGFFFSGDDLDKKIDVLSGGERTRVRLAKMLFSGANTLLLDEPTNHLDLASRRTLEDAMQTFPGTLIFVSHDRVFLERVPTRILEIKNGKLRSFEGNYHDYCRALASLGEESPLVGKTSGKPTGLKSANAAGSANRNQKHESKNPDGAMDSRNPKSEIRNTDASTSTLSHEERKELARAQRRHEKAAEETEKKIAALQKELKEVEDQLMSPNVYSNPAAAAKFSGKQRDLKSQIESLESDWLEQQEKLNALQP